MGSHKSVRGTSYEAIPTPVVDYNVTGTLSPDATCNYFYAGEYNGKSYYRRSDGEAFIWWRIIVPAWMITAFLGVETGPRWIRADPDIIGDYPPGPGATGIATVGVGPH